MSSATKITLTYDNWRFFPWTEEFAGITPPVSEDGGFDGNWKRLIDAVESKYDKSALRRYQGLIHSTLFREK